MNVRFQCRLLHRFNQKVKIKLKAERCFKLNAIIFLTSSIYYPANVYVFELSSLI